MELLPVEVRRQLPALYSQDNVKTSHKIIHLKLIFPLGRWIWYIAEGSEHNGEFLFYGYVIGLTEEWRYFTLRQLEETDICGIRIEIDNSFSPTRFGELLDS